MVSLQPIKRSKLRIFAGKKVYRLKRYSEWLFDGKKYARKRLDEKLPYLIKKHRTPFVEAIERCRYATAKE